MIAIKPTTMLYDVNCEKCGTFAIGVMIKDAEKQAADHNEQEHKAKEEVIRYYSGHR